MQDHEIIHLFHDLADSAYGCTDEITMDDVIAAAMCRRAFKFHKDQIIVHVEFLPATRGWCVRVNWPSLGEQTTDQAQAFSKALEQASTFSMIAEHATLKNLDTDPPKDANDRINALIAEAKATMAPLPQNASAPARKRYRARLAKQVYTIAYEREATAGE